MIRVESHGDVTRYELAGWRNRLMKLSVSIYEIRGAWIDAGYPRARKEVESMAVARAPRGVLISHAHEDHSGNAELLAARGIPLGMPAATRDALQRPHPVRLYRRQTWGSPVPLASHTEAFAPDDLELRPAPGHSPDHHVIWDAATGTLFSADLFMGVRVRVAHSYENPRFIVTSLRTAASWSPDRMFDAHRGAVRQPQRALLAKADWLEETIARIDALMDAGCDDAIVARRLFPGLDPWGITSQGDYSLRNFIGAVRRTRVER